MSYSKWCCYETEILILDGAIRETCSARDEISGADQRKYSPDLSPMTLHDIAVVFSIDAFMELKFPLDIMLKFPMRGEEPSNYDELVEWTKAQMKNYHTILASAMAII